jgi:hypothetical protein|tara:strand:+ start:10828 stop:11004 length:177 start_codon:yes stop_codon:yes gene_type:complete
MEKKNIKHIILNTNIEKLHLAPTNHELGRTNLIAYKRKSDAMILKRSLTTLKKIMILF